MAGKKAETPTLSLVSLRVDDLVPYAKNSRKHNEGQIRAIAASIKEFGFTTPILVSDDNVVIAGHARLDAARSLNMETVPCVRSSRLTKTQIAAYNIVDNRLAEMASWDHELLAAEIEMLSSEDFDVKLLGFSQDFLDRVLLPDRGESSQAGNENMRPKFSVIVELENEEQQAKLLEELEERGFECRALML